MSRQWRFLEPLDVLYLRGNRLFGGPGEHAEALLPPWPSMAAGALRSAALVEAGVTDFAAYREGRATLGTAAPIGTPSEPGEWRLGWFSVAVRRAGDVVAPVLPVPADVVPLPKNETKAASAVRNADCEVRMLRPVPLPKGVVGNLERPLQQIAALRSDLRAKPLTGYWLSADGLERYLLGEPPQPAHLLAAGALYRLDSRLGIALDTSTRTVQMSQLYTSEAVAMATALPGRGSGRVGFLAGIDDGGEAVPKGGLVRLGGDGRAARVSLANPELPEPQWDAIAKDRTFRLVLLSPGLFPGGWRPPGMDSDGIWRGPLGCQARLVAAAVPRAQVVSGWDLAGWRPKAALRAVAAGSVYWFDAFSGDLEGLRKVADEGFWALDGFEFPDRQRRAEGFNRVLVANWIRE